jgi:hypothetical protein
VNVNLTTSEWSGPVHYVDTFGDYWSYPWTHTVAAADWVTMGLPNVNDTVHVWITTGWTDGVDEWYSSDDCLSLVYKGN